MRSKKILIMSGLMALVLGLGISSSAMAYQGDFSKDGLNSDFEAEVTQAITNKDYEGWKDLIEERVGKSKMVEVINKNNFPKFIKAWELAHEGRIKEANIIRRQLSLNK